MDKNYKPDEKLYRAVYPPEVVEMFRKKDGTVSSAAFADPKGLSVDCGNYRSDSEVAKDMANRFTENIVSVYVKQCLTIGAVILYKPSSNNPYHSEIHGSSKNMLLSKSQRYFLAAKAKVL